MRFEGEYKNGEKWDGKGYNARDNSIFEIKQGNGFVREDIFFAPILFEGEYKNGKRNGIGKEYIDGFKIKFDGEFLNGYKISGKEYNDNGNLQFDGIYLYDKKIKGFEYYYDILFLFHF